MARTRNFALVIKKRLAADRDLADGVAEVGFQANVAQQIYHARMEAGLTQAELARRVDSHQSVIARLEDADYDSHTVSMLTRVANALGKDVQVVLKDKSPQRPTGSATRRPAVRPAARPAPKSPSVAKKSKPASGSPNGRPRVKASPKPNRKRASG